jgi:hypothetical protein
MSYEGDDDEKEFNTRLEELQEIEKQTEKEIVLTKNLLKKAYCEETDKRTFCVKQKNIISDLKYYLKELEKEIKKNNKNYPFVYGGSKKTRNLRKNTKIHRKKSKKTRSKNYKL